MKHKPELEMMFGVLDTMKEKCELSGWKRLYSCKAWVTRLKYMGEYIDVLKSYSTIVAVHIPSEGHIFVRDFYSNTTSQHCAKFTKYLREQYINYSEGEAYWEIGHRIRVDKMV